MQVSSLTYISSSFLFLGTIQKLRLHSAPKALLCNGARSAFGVLRRRSFWICKTYEPQILEHRNAPTVHPIFSRPSLRSGLYFIFAIPIVPIVLASSDSGHYGLLAVVLASSDSRNNSESPSLRGRLLRAHSDEGAMGMAKIK